MAMVEIILGSENDLAIVERSGMLDILNRAQVTWNLSVISAHRNPAALHRHCESTSRADTKLYIGIAGMAAHLPGAIAANLSARLPVIGVPLVAEDSLGGLDALLAMLRMPNGFPVAVPGIGKTGLRNAALLACQIIALGNSSVHRNLYQILRENLKQPEFNIKQFERKEEKGGSKNP